MPRRTVVPLLLIGWLATRSTPRVLAEAREEVLKEGLATLVVPSGVDFYSRQAMIRRFPSFEQTEYLRVVAPQGKALDSDDSWWIEMEALPDGHVPMTALPKADAMFERARDAMAAISEREVREGGQTVTLIRWARPPRLNRTARSLSWAEELAIGRAPAHQVFIHTHVFGRVDTLVLTADVEAGEEDAVAEAMAAVASGIRFAEGQGYDDYLEGQDKLATIAPADMIAGTGLVEAQALLAELTFRSGRVTLGDGLATMTLTDRYRYLDPADARRVLVDAWGNPPEFAEGVLGMIFPKGMDPYSIDGWGVIISFDELGHIDDSGAKDMDYERLLAEMKADTAEVNAAREELGYGPMELIGWARPPAYDPQGHALIWSKELRFDDAAETRLNYEVRMLGRRGVLSLYAVTDMEEVSNVQAGMRAIKEFTTFNEGHRYDDYLFIRDPVADIGLAELLGGTTLGAVEPADRPASNRLTWVGMLALYLGLRRRLKHRGSASIEEQMRAAHADLHRSTITTALGLPEDRLRVAFIATEYWAGIVDRIFLIVDANGMLCGAKIGGMSFPPLSEATLRRWFDVRWYLNDKFRRTYGGLDFGSPELLARNSSNFQIKLADIAAVDFDPTRKRRLDTVPHTGKLHLSLKDGRSREFILLGQQDGRAIAANILSLMAELAAIQASPAPTNAEGRP